MVDGYPAEYDRDAYEPIFARVAGREHLVRIGVKRRPQDDIDRRRERRLRREAEARSDA